MIFALLVLTVMLIWTAAVLSRGVSESYVSRVFVYSTKAFWLAEAGLQDAISALNSADWGGWNEPDATTRTKLANLGEGNYTVMLVDIDEDHPSATSTGNVRGVTRTIVADMTRISGGELFNCAIYARGSIRMSGNGQTDSYDSSVGPYGGSNVGPDGDVGTNAGTVGAVGLSGNARVNGDASTGPSGTVTTSGNAEVTGSVTHENDRDLDSVDVPAELEGLTSSGSYSLAANNRGTLSGGDYRYSALSLSGNAILTISGTVRLYLTGASSLGISGNGRLVIPAGSELIIYSEGKCDIAGNGVLNNTNLPENFQLYSTYAGTGDGVKISGNGDLYGAVYAPDTKIAVTGNGDIFGGLVGKEVAVSGNGDVHYDKKLPEIEGFSSRYSIQSWREQNNPYPLSP